MRRKSQPSAIRIDGDTAYVTLTKGLEAMLDASDIDKVSGMMWYAKLSKHREGRAYAYANDRPALLSMHRVIMGTPTGMSVDHIDGNGLNNRRSNLRNCTHRQNMANITSNKRNKLGAKGVSFEYGKYRAKITTDGRTIHLGKYDTQAEAQAAYRGAATVLWGKFASC